MTVGADETGQPVDTQAQEMRMEREYVDFYADERGPLSTVTAALYSQPDATQE